MANTDDHPNFRVYLPVANDLGVEAFWSVEPIKRQNENGEQVVVYDPLQMDQKVLVMQGPPNVLASLLETMLSAIRTHQISVIESAPHGHVHGSHGDGPS